MACQLIFRILLLYWSLFFSIFPSRCQAPYGTTYTNTGAHTMSKGIVRSVYLLPVAAFAITHVVPQIFYAGAYATAPLTAETTGAFTVSVRVHVSAPAAVSSSMMLAVTAVGSWPNATAATQVRWQTMATIIFTAPELQALSNDSFIVTKVNQV